MTLVNDRKSVISVIKNSITYVTGVLDSSLQWLITLWSGVKICLFFFLDYKLRYIWQGKHNLSSTQFYNLIILLLSSNPKGLDLVFRVVLFPNILNQSIHTANLFSWLKIIFLSVKFFLLLSFMQYWLRGNCCDETGQNGVLEMAFLLKNKTIFALVYH